MNFPHKRSWAALAALTLCGSLALAGCSGSNSKSSASATPSTAATGTAALQNVDCSTLTIDSDAATLPTITGDASKEPTIKWSGKEAPKNLTVKTLTAGSGAEITDSDTVTVNYAGWQWGKDDTFDSSYTRGQLATFSLNGVISGWRCGLPGHKVGDRLLMSIPAAYAYGDSSNTGTPTGTLVFVVDVASTQTSEDIISGTKDATMEGEAKLAERGITVSGDLGAAATIKVNDGAAEPTQTETIVLARGKGKEITSDSTLLVHMAFTSWDNTSSQSTWDYNQPQQITMSTATGLEGLVGLPAGSRVVVLLPKATDSTSGSTQPAQAYVIDIESVE